MRVSISYCFFRSTESMSRVYDPVRQAAKLHGCDDFQGGRSKLSRGGVIRDNAVNSILQPPLLSKRAHAPPPSREVSSQLTVFSKPRPRTNGKSSHSNNIAESVNASAISADAFSSAAVSAGLSLFTPPSIQPPVSAAFVQRLGIMASSPVHLLQYHAASSSPTVNVNLFKPPVVPVAVPVQSPGLFKKLFWKK